MEAGQEAAAGDAAVQCGTAAESSADASDSFLQLHRK